MNGYELFPGYWWIFPVAKIILCFLFIGRCGPTEFCGFGRYSSSEDPALSIPRKRFATGSPVIIN